MFINESTRSLNVSKCQSILSYGECKTVITIRYLRKYKIYERIERWYLRNCHNIE